MYDMLTPSSELYLPLLSEQTGPHSYVDSVPVNHNDLGNLIGRLMQMFELNGDMEQRNAQKTMGKHICREWLDAIYADKCAYSVEPYEKLQTVRLDKYIF